MPTNSLTEYKFRKNRSIGWLWIIVIGLCVTLVVTHWETIALWAKRVFHLLTEGFEEESTADM